MPGNDHQERGGFGRGLSVARSRLLAAGAALLAAGLAGCGGGLSDMTGPSMLVAPGKYAVYACQDLETNIRSRQSRQTDLEKLMEKSSGSPAGEFVNVIAYRAEYSQNRAEIDELVRTAQNKQCIIQSPWSSRRVIF